jgi:hypothetical protein
MSVATASLNDTLPSSIPKLDATGLNWAVFSLRFEDAVQAKGFWGHFSGSTPCPTATIESAPTADELAAIEKWEKDERSARSLLTQKLPDSALMRIRNKPSVKERWEAITTEFTQKGAFAQTELRARFLDMKCPEKGNVREFLDSLRVKREELATVGVEIDTKDYLSTIISSLPISLSNFASNQLAAAKLYHSTKTIDPDVLISLISEEYERQKVQRSRRSNGKSPKEDDRDEAMYASSSRGGKAGGRNHKFPRGTCWGCGDKGHFRDKCPKKSKDGKESKDSPKSGSANAAVGINSDSEGEGAFAAVAVDDYESDDSLPDLEVVSDSDSDNESKSGVVVDNDWFSDAADEGASDRECSGGSDWDPDDLFEGSTPAVDAPFALEDPGTPEHVAAFVSANNNAADTSRTEIYDSGCTSHISPYRNNLENFIEISPKSFRAANKQDFNAVGKGEMVIDVPNGADISQLRLTEVLYAPEVGYTLVSVGRLDDNGFSATFGGGKCVLRGPDGEELGSVPKSSRGLYKVVHEGESVNTAVEGITLDLLHRRMGHISPGIAKKLVTSGFVTGVRLVSTADADFFCESCVYAKATRKSIPKAREGERAKKFGEEVHSDLWGPAPVETKGGRRYYITFVDDYTRFTHLHLLRTKDEAFEAYKQFEAWSANQLEAPIRVLHSDRGGEYLGKEFTAYLKSKGTAQKLTVHHTPQHNGVAERRNRTIVERIRALLHASGLPKYLWGEAARHVVWLMNHTSMKAVEGKTPYEAALGMKPDLSGVREWGEKCWVRVEKGNKLGGRVREGRWVGVDDESKGARVYWRDTKTVTVERNVYFDPTSASVDRLEGEDWQFVETTTDELTSTPTPIFPTVATPPAQSEQIVSAPAEDEHEEDEPRAKRTRKPSQRVLEILSGRAVSSSRPSDPIIAPGIQVPTAVVEEPEGEETPDVLMADNFVEYAMVADMSEVEGLEPRSLAEAKRGPDWLFWEKAIFEELRTLEEAGTWELVDPPSGANIVGSKWVFRVKKDAAGHVVRFKARLVAQGFSQVPGVDYFDTFAPVAKLASIRTVLAMAAELDFELHQIDIKSAYLNGELTKDENIYMKQPPGYPAPNSSGKVCHLLKTLYGLKQSGRRWYQKLVEILVKRLAFVRSDVDQAVFYRHGGDNSHATIIVVVHVDDCTIAASTLSLVVAFKRQIAQHVEITDLGELHWLLGIEIKRDRERRTIHLSQRSYIDSIIARYNFQDLKPVSTPMETSTRLSTSQAPATTLEIAKMRDVPYLEAVGSLMYASLGTRPDISFAVQTVSRFSKNPGLTHWDAVKRIFRYLKGTADLWLSYGVVKDKLVGYADADGSMAEDRHAISGYAFMLFGGAVSWSAKRQEIVSLSTTESEYVAVTHAAKEGLWIRSLLSQLFPGKLDPTTLFSDNQSAIALAKDHQYHARTKHIDIRFHFIRYVIENGSIRLIYCPTDDMVADTLTKALPSAKVKHFASQLGLSAP